ELRGQAVSRSDELLAAFLAARQLKQQLAVLDQIIKNIDAFAEPAQLQSVIRSIEQSARQGQRLHTAQAFELVLARDEICAKCNGVHSGANALTLSQLLRDEER